MAKSKRLKNSKIVNKKPLSDGSMFTRIANNLPYAQIKKKITDLYERLKKQRFDAHSAYAIVGPKLRRIKNIVLKTIHHWKFLTIFLPSFILFYYFLGGMLAENIDVNSEYKLKSKHLPMLETAESMSFLIKREVDDKMWTPNLPIVFPASVLDNMPNFQIGIVAAVKNLLPALQKSKQNTSEQKKDLKAAAKLLSYPPDVWLMTRKGKLNLAPSSNAQYRKAAAELRKFAHDGIFSPNKDDLERLLQNINKHIQEITLRNETQQLEKSGDWIDVSSDDLFYFAKGYAFALWQIAKTMGADFKEVILEQNLYTEWTYFVNSLKNAAEFEPRVIRNGAPESLTKPNHLIMQNFYLQRAMIAAEKICNGLLRTVNAD